MTRVRAGSTCLVVIENEPEKLGLPTPSLPEDALLRFADLCRYLPWSRASIAKLVQEPHFPAAIALPGPRSPRLVWQASEIRDWVQRAPRVRPPVPRTFAMPADVAPAEPGVAPHSVRRRPRRAEGDTR